MKTRLILLLTLGGFLAVADRPAPAQDDATATPAPAHPAIISLTGNFSLVKKFVYRPDPSGAAAATTLVEVDAVKSGPIRKDVHLFAAGKGQEVWREQNFRLTMFPNDISSAVVDRVTTHDDIYSTYRYHDSSDFPELDWAANAGFIGVKMNGDKKCFLYKLNDQTLWVEADNGAPLYYESKTLKVTYTWSAPPGEPLQLPPGAAAEIEKFKRRL